MQNSKVPSAFLSDLSFQADQLVEMQSKMEINFLTERNQDLVRRSLKLFQESFETKTKQHTSPTPVI